MWCEKLEQFFSICTLGLHQIGHGDCGLAAGFSTFLLKENISTGAASQLPIAGMWRERMYRWM